MPYKIFQHIHFENQGRSAALNGGNCMVVWIQTSKAHLKNQNAA